MSKRTRSLAPRLLILGLPLAVLGCGGGPPPPNEFEGNRSGSSYGITYKGPGELRDCTVSVVMFYEEGTSEAKRNWSTWASGEQKKVDLTKSGFQWCQMKGTAKRGAESYPIQWSSTK